MLSLNETDSRLKETIWRQTKFQLKHAWSQKSQGDSHHSGPSQFSGTEQQFLWEVPVELLLWPSLNHAGNTTFHSLKDRATFRCPFLILFSGRQLSKKTKCSDRDKTKEKFFGKNLVYCYCDWQKTAWKDNKSEATTVRRLHIWIFSSLRIWAHLILQQESWKAQHKVRAMRDLYMKNTLSQRDIQSFFSPEILFYTNMAGGKKLAYEDDENSHSKLCLRSISRNSRGLFPNALRSMSSHFSIDSSSRRNCRSAKRVPFYTSFISSTKNFGAIMTSCGFQYIPSHHEM